MDLQTQLIKNNPERYQDLLKNIDQLNQIQIDLLNYVNNQDEKINTLEENITVIDENVINANKDLSLANDYSFKYTPVLVGTVLGGLTMGPLGIVLNLKAGSLVTLTGSLVGAFCGYKIQK